MKRFIVVSIILACLHSCGKKVDDTIDSPPGILEKEKFTDLLVDFALAESAANLNIKNLNIQQLDSGYAFDPLIDNKVRRSQYDSSLAFYASHPEIYKIIYDSVLVRLSEIKTSRLTRDSISK